MLVSAIVPIGACLAPVAIGRARGHRDQTWIVAYSGIAAGLGGLSAALSVWAMTHATLTSPVCPPGVDSLGNAPLSCLSPQKSVALTLPVTALVAGGVMWLIAYAIAVGRAGAQAVMPR